MTGRMRYGMSSEEARELADRLPAPENPADRGFTSSVFGLAYDPEWREVKAYEPATSDGHRAVVMVSRLPAQFWRVICPDLGIDMATGSDLGDLATAMAEAIADGCLGPREA